MKKLLPSFYVISLMMFFTLPGFIIDYSLYISSSQDFRSLVTYLTPYFFALSSALLAGIILLVLNIFLFRWEEYSIWRKYFIIIIAYAFTCFVFLFSFLYVEEKMYKKGINVYHGEPEGSWFMLTCPSVGFYAVTGLLFCLIYEFLRAIREYKKPPPSE